MDKKFTFSDQPTTSKIIYGIVIGILCVSAIVVAIVAANNRKQPTPPVENPPIVNPGEGGSGDPVTPPDENQDTPTPPQPEPPTLVAPTIGTVTTGHSLTVPVFSDTLKEWRVHTGVDISTEEGAKVFAAADGTVSAIYTDPLYGITVEITHASNIKTIYSNLSETLPSAITVGATIRSGEQIGTVGDTAMGELALEPHLHFGVKIKDVSVNPLDYLSEDSKKNALGMTDASPAA